MENRYCPSLKKNLRLENCHYCGSVNRRPVFSLSVATSPCAACESVGLFVHLLPCTKPADQVEV